MHNLSIGKTWIDREFQFVPAGHFLKARYLFKEQVFCGVKTLDTSN
jgi:hypothetical protein